MEDEEDVVSERLYEYKDKSFKIKQINPYGYWIVCHVNSRQVAKLPGQYTSLNAAIRDIHTLSDEWFKEHTRVLKTVLVPKGKKEPKINAEEASTSD